MAAEVIEEDGLEVALSSAGKDGDDDFAAIFFFARFLQGGPGDGAAADADGESFTFEEVDGGGDGVVIGDGDDAFDEVDAEGVGLESSAKAFDAVGARTPTREDGAGGGFDGDDLEGWFAGAQCFCEAGEGAAGADADDDHIYGSAGVLPDFEGGAFAVGFRVSLIVELLGEPGVGEGGAQFDDFVDGAAHTLVAGSEDDLSAETLQKEAAFEVDGVGHGEDAGVATGSGDPGEGDAHVTAGGFDDGVACAEESLVFGIADHLQGYAGFEAAAGAEHFGVGEQGWGQVRDDALQLDEGSFADEFGGVFCPVLGDGGGAHGVVLSFS